MSSVSRARSGPHQPPGEGSAGAGPLAGRLSSRRFLPVSSAGVCAVGQMGASSGDHSAKAGLHRDVGNSFESFTLGGDQQQWNQIIYLMDKQNAFISLPSSLYEKNLPNTCD